MGTDRRDLSSLVEERLLSALAGVPGAALPGRSSTAVSGCAAGPVSSVPSDLGSAGVPLAMSVGPGCGCVASIVLVLPGSHVAGAARVRLEHVVTVPVTAVSVTRLVSELLAIDSALLDSEGLLMRVRLADRVAAWAQATASAALADYTGPATGDVAEERQRRFEVRVARSCSDDAAARDIVAARSLAGPCRRVRDLWARGDISGRHVFAVLDRTALVTDEVTEIVVDRLVDRLPQLPSSRVRAEVTKQLAKVDPRGQAQRVRVARKHHVGVAYRSMPDGLAQIIATHTVEDARTVMELVDTAADRFLAHRRDCPSCAEAVPDEIGPARATAHVALVLRGADRVLDGIPGTDGSRGGCDGEEISGAVAVSGDLDVVRGEKARSDAMATATGHDTDHVEVACDGHDAQGRRTSRSGTTRRRRRSRRPGELQVVIDLATLLGLADDPCLVAGEPVPAEIARELVGECGSLRRVVTDPVTGYLLDYGTRVYLPEALVRFVQPRDGTCRSPGCGQPAWRCQLDHRDPFPLGASSAENGQSLCKRDHDLKHAGGWTVTRRDPDGTLHWRTRDGQTGTTPPRPYLNDPGDDRWDTPPAPYDPDTDPPPF